MKEYIDNFDFYKNNLSNVLLTKSQLKKIINYWCAYTDSADVELHHNGDMFFMENGNPVVFVDDVDINSKQAQYTSYKLVFLDGGSSEKIKYFIIFILRAIFNIKHENKNLVKQAGDE